MTSSSFRLTSSISVIPVRELKEWPSVPVTVTLIYLSLGSTFWTNDGTTWVERERKEVWWEDLDQRWPLQWGWPEGWWLWGDGQGNDEGDEHRAVHVDMEVVLLAVVAVGVLLVARLRWNRSSFLLQALLIPRPQSSRMVLPTPLLETHDFLWLLPVREDRAAHLS